MAVSTCPNERQIAALVQGLLLPADAEQLLEHLDSCEVCGSTADQLLQRGDTLIEHLREASASGDIELEPACADALAHLKLLDLEQLASGAVAASEEKLQRLGDYELLEILGEGGMGTVYRAVHTKLGKTVALKLLSPLRRSKPGRAERFAREIKALGSLDHPHIVRASDARDEDGLTYLVMEYVAGFDLSRLVKRVGPLPINSACEIVRQAAVGLHAAHQRGLIHRDVKPSNIMLSDPGTQTEKLVVGSAESGIAATVKILDLGLARVQSEEVQADPADDGLVLGTADFMAPEQALSGATADERADVYSLGCTLFFLLTGRAPFRDGRQATSLQVLAAHARQQPISIEQLRSDAPRSLGIILNKLLAKVPADRYQSMPELAADLVPLVRGADLFAVCEAARSGQQLALAAPTVENVPTCGHKFALAHRARWIRWGIVVASLALLAGIAAALIVIRLDVGEGTLVVEFSGDALEAEVRNQQVTLRSLAGGKPESFVIEARQTEHSLPPGKYRIVVAAESGLRFEGGDEVEIGKGKTNTIVARYVPRGEAPAKPLSDDGAHIAAAQRIIALNGVVGLKLKDGVVKECRATGDLPEAPWEIVSIHVGCEWFTDADLKLLAPLSTLRSLAVENANISDQGLSALSGLTGLVSLSLIGTKISSTAMPHLVSLSQLETLNLGFTEVTDRGLRSIAKMPSLELLVLPKSVTGVGLEVLADLPKPIHLEIQARLRDDEVRHLAPLKLKGLVLDGANLTGEGLIYLTNQPALSNLEIWSSPRLSLVAIEHAQKIPSLRRLNLESSHVSLDVLTRVAELKGLDTLILDHCGVTDEGLAKLQALTTLRSLRLKGSSVTEQALQRFQAALPDCQVSH